MVSSGISALTAAASLRQPTPRPNGAAVSGELNLSPTPGMNDEAPGTPATTQATPAPPLPLEAEVDPLIGATIGSFKVAKKLGVGGMGTVYLGEQGFIGSKVAIKVLHPHLASNASLVQRFYAEARAANVIGHEHIVNIIDLNLLPPNRYYFIMEYLEGKQLSELPRPVPQALLVHLLAQVCDALQAAHTNGVVHRDLKPENIVLIKRGRNDQFVKILDFGIAKLFASELAGQRTAVGVIMGTPEFMAPEQTSAEEVDGRSDLYSLGVIAYELATGRLPFIGSNVADLLIAHRSKEPVPPHLVNAGVPLDVSNAIMKALAKQPADRWQCADEFCAALEATMQGQVPYRSTPSLATPGQPSAKAGTPAPGASAVPMSASSSSVAAPAAPIVAPAAPIVAPAAPIVAPTAPIVAPTAPIVAPAAPIVAPTAPIAAPAAPAAAWPSSPSAQVAAPGAPAWPSSPSAAQVAAAKGPAWPSSPSAAQGAAPAPGATVWPSSPSAAQPASSPSVAARSGSSGRWASNSSVARRPTSHGLATPTNQDSSPSMAIRAPSSPSEPGSHLYTRVFDQPNGGFRLARATDLSRGGMFVQGDATLPAMFSRLKLSLMLPDGPFSVQAEVVRHVTEEQSKAWGMPVGFGVQFVDLTATQRDELGNLLKGVPRSQASAVRAEEREDPKVEAALVAFKQRTSGSHYELFDLPDDIDFAEVRGRARDAKKLVADLRANPMSQRQRERLDAVDKRLDEAMASIGQPKNRLDYDATRANWKGVAKCIAGGVSVNDLEQARRRFLATHPGAEGTAHLHFTTANAWETQRQFARAVDEFERALTLDPLNLAFHQRYQALKRLMNAPPPKR